MADPDKDSDRDCKWKQIDAGCRKTIGEGIQWKFGFVRWGHDSDSDCSDSILQTFG